MKKRDTIMLPAGEVPGSAPKTRDVPLPWQSPKSAKEDNDAPMRLAAILKSQAYLQADEDVAFEAPADFDVFWEEAKLAANKARRRDDAVEASFVATDSAAAKGTAAIRGAVAMKFRRDVFMIVE